MDIEKIFSDRRSCLAHIGMDHEEFLKFLPYFEKAYLSYKRRNGKPNVRNAGRKSTLDTIEKRLFFVLYYFKTYPTFDVLGGTFGMDRGTACKWVHRYTEVLLEALQKMKLLPMRRFKSKKEFIEYFPEIRLVVIDGTERRQQRPQNSEKQKEHYSGKKNSIR